MLLIIKTAPKYRSLAMKLNLREANRHVQSYGISKY